MTTLIRIASRCFEFYRDCRGDFLFLILHIKPTFRARRFDFKAKYFANIAANVKFAALTIILLASAIFYPSSEIPATAFVSLKPYIRCI
jgi:hypothetical protein